MRPYFVGHPIATVLFLGTLAVWLVVDARQALNRRPGATPADRGSRLILGLSVAVGVVVAVLAAARARSASLPESGIVFAAGLACMWAGMGLRWWSFRTLGRYFTFTVMTSRDQPVIAEGPYRFVRHPSYLGVLLVLTGIGTLYGNWLSLAAFVLFPLVGFVHRIGVEENALSADLGDAYVSYASRRKRLIPFVW